MDIAKLNNIKITNLSQSHSDNELDSVASVDSDASLDSITNTTGVNDESNTDYCNYKLDNTISCNNQYTKECNKFLLKKELIERKCLEETEDENPFLYPNLNDKEFNVKIASKKEFAETKYDGEIHKDIQAFADELSKKDFELQPHQTFVKNFLSHNTPYNSLLLYHGLGTGKTCSAIGVSEEMRDYMKQTNIMKRIIIVASENVQDNFKLQLFDERNLKIVDGVWNINSCVGSKLIREINPANLKGVTKSKIVSQIKNLINTSYLFLGYGQFANYIIKTIDSNEVFDDNSEISHKILKRLNNEFSDRLIIIDEVHNIRKSDDNENKKVATYLEILVKYTNNLRLLLLSATPMFNNFKEIFWLINLMNINDRRGIIKYNDVFDKEGNFKNGGKELLVQKITGYVSYVRGENPYTFPYRIYPSEFAKEHTFFSIPYPKYQMNLKKINETDKKRIIDLYITKLYNCDNCGECQRCAYNYVIEYLRNKQFSFHTKKGKEINMPNFENMESFGYTLLQNPLRSLIISYPDDNLKELITIIKSGNNTDNNFHLDPNELTGKSGLSRIMNFKETNVPPEKGSYAYKKSTLDKYGPIFKQDMIGKYSSKIKNVLDCIYDKKTNKISEGIILIYSQYIDGGLIPMALALEEMGFIRYGNNTKNLFKENPTDTIDVRTMQKPKDKKNYLPAQYSLITGDRKLSPDNDYEVKGLTNFDNNNGERIKVILISKAGTEGIDFKNIRQVHILDPWYTMNRLEQIIGRAVRNFSHKSLNFEKRNVQIFIYGTIIEGSEEEAADLYVYRIAEAKAIQIGKVSRLLKETAVDCILNHEQTNFTSEKIASFLDKPIKQTLSTGKIITDYNIGDKPYTPICDYMDNCYFKCTPGTVDKINEDSYSEAFITNNNDKIIQKIKQLMKEQFFYKKSELISRIQSVKKYPYSQIYSSLTKIIDENEIIIDKYGRSGKLINIDQYYLFQPSELMNKNISIFERSVPIDYKHKMIELEISKDIFEKDNKTKVNETYIHDDHSKPDVFDDITNNYKLYIKYTDLTATERGDDNWYKHAGVITKQLINDYPDIKEHLTFFLFAHAIEQLFYDEKIKLLNYIYSITHVKNNSPEWYIKSYFNTQVFNSSNHQVLLFYKLNELIILVLNDDNKWITADPETTREIALDSSTKTYLAFDPNKYNTYVGFIGYKKNNSALVFKTKDMNSSRDTGATCEESGKEKSIKKLNLIIGEDKWNKENTKLKKDTKGNVITPSIGQIDLCILQELILRYFELSNRENKKWFLTPEMAIYHKLYKIFV